MAEVSGIWLAHGETIVRSKSYPFNIQHPVIPVVPTVPEQTFTLKGGGPLLPLGDAVYFMYSAGRIKIGFSNHVWSRREALCTSSPFPPVIVFVERGSVALERKYHARFAKNRLHGEWFDLSGLLRRFLTVNLCQIGAESLCQAEADFREYCRLTVSRRPSRSLGRAWA